MVRSSPRRRAGQREREKPVNSRLPLPLHLPLPRLVRNGGSSHSSRQRAPGQDDEPKVSVKMPASTDDFTEWKGSMESAMLDEKTGAARRLQLLKALRGAEPTVEVLQETKIGLTVNALRKDSSEDVRTLASALLQKWKALYRAQKSNDEQK